MKLRRGEEPVEDGRTGSVQVLEEPAEARFVPVVQIDAEIDPAAWVGVTDEF